MTLSRLSLALALSCLTSAAFAEEPLIMVPTTPPSVDDGPTASADVCFTSRIRAAVPEHGTVILESTPVGRSMAEADGLGLRQCRLEYPAADCQVAGHAIADCPTP